MSRTQTLHVLDTDTVIWLIRKNRLVVQRALEHEHSLALSTVTLSELLYGATRSNALMRQREMVHELAGFMTVLEFDAAAAEHAAEIRAHLAGAGTPIGQFDLLIAATARSRGATVVTGNVREFSRVPGLNIENWRS